MPPLSSFFFDFHISPIKGVSGWVAPSLLCAGLPLTSSGWGPLSFVLGLPVGVSFVSPLFPLPTGVSAGAFVLLFRIPGVTIFLSRLLGSISPLCSPLV